MDSLNKQNQKSSDFEEEMDSASVDDANDDSSSKSMDEILASIRKIISNNEQEESKANQKTETDHNLDNVDIALEQEDVQVKESNNQSEHEDLTKILNNIKSEVKIEQKIKTNPTSKKEKSVAEKSDLGKSTDQVNNEMVKTGEIDNSSNKEETLESMGSFVKEEKVEKTIEKTIEKTNTESQNEPSMNVSNAEKTNFDHEKSHEAEPKNNKIDEQTTKKETIEKPDIFEYISDTKTDFSEIIKEKIYKNNFLKKNQSANHQASYTQSEEGDSAELKSNDLSVESDNNSNESNINNVDINKMQPMPSFAQNYEKENILPKKSNHEMVKPQSEASLVSTKLESQISEIVNNAIESRFISSRRDVISTLRPIELKDDTTLRDLVSEMIRPMLADWMEVHLHEIVQEAVDLEVKRLLSKKK